MAFLKKFFEMGKNLLALIIHLRYVGLKRLFVERVNYELRNPKIIIIGLIGAIFLAGNVLLIANWLAGKGIPEKAS